MLRELKVPVSAKEVPWASFSLPVTSDIQFAKAPFIALAVFADITITRAQSELDGFSANHELGLSDSSMTQSNLGIVGLHSKPRFSPVQPPNGAVHRISKHRS